MITKYNLIKNDLYELLKEKDFFCFDVETTGLSPIDDRIIQISIIHGQIQDDMSIKEIDRFSTYIYPGKNFLPLPDKIVKLTGISTQTIENEGLPEDIAQHKILNFMGESPCITGWNVNFDYNFLKSLYARQLQSFHPKIIIDTMKIAKQTIPKKEVANYKLKTIADHLHLSDQVAFHNAEDDTYVTYLIFGILFQEILDTKDNQNNISQRIRPIIYYLYAWQKSYGRSHLFKRIYFVSNVGKFYLDLYTDEFGSKDVDLNQLDMEYVKQFLYWATKTDSVSIHNFKGKIQFK